MSDEIEPIDSVSDSGSTSTATEVQEPATPQASPEPQSEAPAREPQDASDVSDEARGQDDEQPHNLDVQNFMKPAAEEAPAAEDAGQETPPAEGEAAAEEKPASETQPAAEEKPTAPASEDKPAEKGEEKAKGDDRYQKVTIQPYGSGKNDSVWSALRGAGYSNKEIVKQGLVKQVAELNGLKNPNVVQDGQELRIPRKGEGGEPAAGGGAAAGNGGTATAANNQAPAAGKPGDTAPAAQGETAAAPQAENRTQSQTNVDTLRDNLPGPLKKYAESFVKAGEKYGVDPKFLAAISMHETGGGKSSAFRNKNNAMGISNSRGPIRMSSVESSIDRMAKGLARPDGYYRGKTTISGIGGVYAPIGAGNDPRGLNNYWVKGVSNNYRALGGNPSSQVIFR